MNGVPSALQYTAGASLPPGDYNLKLAVAEGDRVGSVEHAIHAALPNAGGLAFSELMVGGPLDAGELLTPTIGYTVTFGMLHGYVEAYGPRAPGVTAEYEVATKADAPALINARRAGLSRRRRRRDLLASDAGATAAAGQVRAARDFLRAGQGREDADAAVRSRAAESADDLGRGTGHHVSGQRAVPAGRRGGARRAFQT